MTKFFTEMNLKPSEEKAEEMHYKRTAETEKFKGNEYMSSKEYMLAIDAYTSSVELDSTVAAVFSNRALAYLNVKDYERALDDADECLLLD